MPISCIYTGNNYIKILEEREKDRDKKIKKEVLDFVGDKFYNLWGIWIHPNEIY